MEITSEILSHQLSSEGHTFRSYRLPGHRATDRSHQIGLRVGQFALW